MAGIEPASFYLQRLLLPKCPIPYMNDTGVLRSLQPFGYRDLLRNEIAMQLDDKAGLLEPQQQRVCMG